MSDAQKIPWNRIAAEATAIVLSILLAFAIDAWWDDRREASVQHVQLQALLGEFEEARHQLELQIGGLEVALGGTVRVLELTGPDASGEVGQVLRAALKQSLNIGVFSPQQGSLQDVLATRGDIAYSNSELWSLLQSWPAIVSDLQNDGQHLERNREEDFVGALVRLGVPMSPLVITEGLQSRSIDGIGLNIPLSKFDVDWEVLLRDPGIETVFTMRAIRSQLLLSNHQYAVEVANRIIAHLRENL